MSILFFKNWKIEIAIICYLFITYSLKKHKEVSNYDFKTDYL